MTVPSCGPPTAERLQAIGWNRTSPTVHVTSIALLAGGAGAYVDAQITADALIQAGIGGGVTVEAL